MRRSAALNTYETRVLNRLSPVLTTTYLSRREVSPIEDVRTKFIEQPYKLRNDLDQYLGKPIVLPPQTSITTSTKNSKPGHTRTKSSLYNSIKNARTNRASYDSNAPSNPAILHEKSYFADRAAQKRLDPSGLHTLNQDLGHIDNRVVKAPPVSARPYQRGSAGARMMMA